MALHIDPNQGVITITRPGKDKATVLSLPELGWDLTKNVTFSTTIPCFAAGGFPLPVDLLFRDDDGHALALIVSGIPLDDEGKLRTIADFYTNSAKRAFGQRPAVYFVDGVQCKAANGVLGTFQTQPQLMPKDVYREFVASHNIQEETAFHAMLEDVELAKQFVTGKLDAQHINRLLSDALEQAKQKGGFAQYYHHLCPKEEDRQHLLKQAVLLGAMGEESYIRFLQQQTRIVRGALNQKSRAIFQKGLAQDRWLPVEENSTMESRMLDWAFAYHGWDRKKDLRKNESIPCYLEPSMELLADYTFLEPNGKPVLLLLRDTLDLSEEKRFLAAEFYARSWKAQFGLMPFVILVTKDGALLKMGAMSGGFDPIKELLPKVQLIAQAACVNITEMRAWNALLPHVEELKGIASPKEQLERQMALIHESVAETTKLLEDQTFVKETFASVISDKELLEETFWKRMVGEQTYLENRKQEGSFLRTFVADKRIASGTV
ncbi:MAG: hypothetical protein PUC32_07740 [Oscillospiraceae bacterium]|nr:hypothetical protein [Oscillospiraceae bacterium]